MLPVIVAVYVPGVRKGSAISVVVAARVAAAPVPLGFTGAILKVPLVGYNVFALRLVIVYDVPETL
jgi:hypothetical protein